LFIQSRKAIAERRTNSRTNYRQQKSDGTLQILNLTRLVNSIEAKAERRTSSHTKNRQQKCDGILQLINLTHLSNQTHDS